MQDDHELANMRQRALVAYLNNVYQTAKEMGINTTKTSVTQSRSELKSEQ
jgi:hypothetical protein